MKIKQALFALLAGLFAAGSLFAQDGKGLDVWKKKIAFKDGETIAFLGDSITAGGAGKEGYCRLVEAAIKESHPDQKVKYIFAGVSGNKVPNLQKRIDNDVLKKKPTIVFIYIGINDVWHKEGTPKDKYEEGLRDLVKRVQDAGATVVLATPSVIGEKLDGAKDAQLDEYAAISRKVASDNSLVVCDLRATFVEHLKNNKTGKGNVLTSDGVHLNKAGNRFVADRCSEAIVEAIAKRK